MKPMMRAHPLWNEGERLAALRDWPGARGVFLRLLDETRNDATVLVQLSYIESLAGRYRDARSYALRAVETPPREPAVAAELAARLRTFNEAQALRRLIEKIGPPSRMPITMLLSFAAQESYLNDQSRALALLDEAIRGDPSFPPSLLARGQVLMYLGRLGDARRDVEKAARLAPEIAQAWWLLARLSKQSRDSNHVDAIAREMNRPGRRPADIAQLAEALHKELDDMHDHEGAWQALVRMCQAKRPMLDYSQDGTTQLIDGLIAHDLLQAGLHSAARSDAQAATPVFIVGMHRSGTTLLEQLLDGHDDVRGIGELYDFTSAMRYATDHHCKGVIDATIVERSAGVDFAEVGARYMDGVRWRLGREAFFTDKLPSNFLNAGFICTALPQAKLLHMVRDPIETCFSNLRELFSSANAYSYDQAELADFYIQYRRLMAHWHAAFPGRILDVDYARLVSDPESVLREVCAFLGLEFQPSMLNIAGRTRGVATASAVQVREGIVKREVPKWKPYERHLQPLIGALREAGFV